MPAHVLMKFIRTFGLIVVACLLLAVAAVAFLEATFRPVERSSPSVKADRGHLQGRVTKAKGWIPFVLPGIPGADVVLSPQGLSAVSDQDGNFDIPDVTPGVYTVTFSAAGFEPVAVDSVQVNAGAVTLLPDEALFAAPDGPPRADLKPGSMVPFLSPPDTHPYRTAVLLDATAGRNMSATGIRFEIRDAAGNLLIDPYAAGGQALQPKGLPVPGMPRALYQFTPPGPGTYTVRISLTNDAAPGSEDSAEIELQAVNTAPEALPLVIAGPNLPDRTPSSAPRVSSGLNVVSTGAPVYLKGLGFDANHAAPELYNPGGTVPDTYGKNNDHRQRQFTFNWELFYLDAANGVRNPASELLRGSGQASTTEGQVVSFVAAQPGRYEAVLRVTDNDPYGALDSEPAMVSILAIDNADQQDGNACAGCHQERVVQYRQTRHSAVGVGCENCHGPAEAHLSVAADGEDYVEHKRATQDVSHESGVCGQCHAEYAEWEKSRHADGMPYGHEEISPPLMVTCSKCHYARTFQRTLETAAADGVAFHDIDYKQRIAGIGPLMPDLSKMPRRNDAGVTCTACHAPHDGVTTAGLRAGSAGATCQTCHEEKWQNAVLEGTAGEVRNGFEYPGENYELRNPHNTDAKCAHCHLSDQTGTPDPRGVRAVGGHSLRMRDAGANGELGGFGPRWDDPSQARSPDESDDVLHVAPCRQCHRDTDTFDINGFQRRIHDRWTELGELLLSANNNVLPTAKPGDKCATCHRGGTLPFDDDPYLILENAYTNYKLIGNDRSWGVHNPRYVEKLLVDSIAAVQGYLGHETQGIRKAAP